mmetsp:Transcript_123682/g.309106  ORF Transcript_123682/g.309106 Transcript_123682/m.309106 type:complete len:477 (-) Transcript_123682:21-1451(-)
MALSIYVAVPASQAWEMASQGITSEDTFVRASEWWCKEADVVVFQVDGDLASKHECDIRPVKAGEFHIMTKHIPAQYLSVVSAPEWWSGLEAESVGASEPNDVCGTAQPDPARLDGPCSNVFRRWSGECLMLTPLPDTSDALKDVRRRIAALIGVGVWQISLSCGGAQLEGLTLGQALQGSSEDISVSVQHASVYSASIETARQSKGLVRIGMTTFPKPQNININMMPFVMGNKSSLPKQYHGYWPMIERCLTPLERGKIGFLTIQESAVKAGNSQRRPGLHLETPGIVMRRGRVVDVRLAWGQGEVDEGEQILGGLYTASTVRNSCRAWDMRIGNPKEVVGPLGEAEHLRELLGDGEVLANSILYWMTDATPHESMPLAENATRQYFRLVTSDVSVWYEKHSTRNPNGIKPDPKVTRILTHDKFADIANVEGALTRQPDEVWDFKGRGFGEDSEDKIVTRCLKQGEFLPQNRVSS